MSTLKLSKRPPQEVKRAEHNTAAGGRSKVDRQHYYPEVPGLGAVAVSRSAQARMDEYRISQKAFECALLSPTREVEDGPGVLWREHNNVRLVILEYPRPYSGAKLVTSVLLVEPQARARERRS